MSGTHVSIYCAGGSLSSPHEEWLVDSFERQWALEVDGGQWLWVRTARYRRDGRRIKRLGRKSSAYLEGDQYRSGADLEADPDLLAGIRQHYNFQCARCRPAWAGPAEPVHAVFEILVAAGVSEISLQALRARLT